MNEDLKLINDNIEQRTKKVKIEDIADHNAKSKVTINDINVKELKIFDKILT